MHLGGGELLILLLIVIVLFGAGRISRLGGELGSGIREFRRGLQSDEKASADSEKAS
jgi:sec-independent protein translocase protein TatA